MMDPWWRVQAYLSLSQLLQQPDKALLEYINGTEFQEIWEQVNVAYDLQLPETWVGTKLPSLEDFGWLWNITMGPITPLAEPIESLYKIWTTDPSCENLIATQKGYLKSDWGCHMEALLATVGCQLPPQFSHCPDHLILEFEFFSLLIEKGSVEAQLKFAEHHFDWLEDLVQTAKEKEVPQIYQDLYNLCLQYVKTDIASLKSENVI